MNDAQGVAGVYSGGVIWGVRRPADGDEPVIWPMAPMGGDGGEENARAMVRFINEQCDRLGTPEHRAELLAARIHWQVQE